MINREQLEEHVYTSLGAASVCWENPKGAGEFYATACKKVGDELMKAIDKYVEGELYYASLEVVE